MTQIRWGDESTGSELAVSLRKHFPRKRSTILVVEDSPVNAGLLEAVFATGLSYTKGEVALSCEEAREYLRQRDPPTLITLDLFLPDASGLDLLEWLGRDHRFADIPVVIFTSSSSPEHARRAYALGARRYLVKPADFGELVTAVKKELSRWADPRLDAARAG